MLGSISEVQGNIGRNKNSNVLIQQDQPKLLQFNTSTKTRPFNKKKIRAQKSSPQCFVKAKKREDATLLGYWIQKDKIDKKYDKLLEEISVEEAAEIKHITSRIFEKIPKQKGKEVLELITDVKEDYEITRGLLIKQKIAEEEEVINAFKQKLKLKNS